MHRWQQFNDPSVGPYGSRMQRSLDSLCEANDAAEFYRVPIIINGDLMHTKTIDAIVQKALIEHFDATADDDVYYYISAGNHDRPDKSNRHSTLTAFNQLENVMVFDGVWHIDLDIDENKEGISENRMRIVMLPFMPQHTDVAIQQAANMVDTLAYKYHVFMGHYPLQGAMVGSGYTLDSGPKYEDFLPDYYDLLLFNDIHKQQPVGDKGYHLGATHANSFSDANYDCHWWLLGVDQYGPCIWPIKSSITGFKVTDDVEEACELEHQGHFTRIKLSEQIEFTKAVSSDTPRAAAHEGIDGLISAYLGTTKFDSMPQEHKDCVKQRIIWAIEGARTA